MLLIRFCPRPHLENLAFVDDKLTIVTEGNLKTI